jgi:hypothetical protein
MERESFTGQVRARNAAEAKAGTDRASLDASILSAIRAGLPSYPSGKSEALLALTEFVRSLGKVSAA